MGSETCYFSVFGYDSRAHPFQSLADLDEFVKQSTCKEQQTNGNTSSSPSSGTKAVLYLHTDNPLHRYSKEEFVAFNLFNDLFGDINGSLLSQKDRGNMALLWEAEQVFAYSETDYTVFQDILTQAGAVDG